MEFRMKENGFQGEFDFGTLDVSGEDEYGFRPYQLLAASVAVCSGGVLKKILIKKRIKFDDITIQVDIKRNEGGVQEITDIHLHFIIIGGNASKEKLVKSLEVARKNCPIVQSVHNSINISESIDQKEC